MASATTFIYASVAFVIITVLFLIAIAQNSVDEKKLMPTPTIPIQNSVLTSFASTKIKASVEVVFAAMINFKGDSTWSTFSGYKWDSVAADGVPLNGTTGSFKLSLDDFPARTLPIKLTVLDRESKRIAVMTTHYPHWLLGSERVQEVVPVEGEPGLCEYRTWQTLTGVAAYYLLLTARDELSESQARCAHDLKSFIENGKQ